MKIIALAGLHGAGKSHFAQALHARSGWPRFAKLEVLRRLYVGGWEHDPDAETWEGWYAHLYPRIGGDAVIRRVLAEMGEHPVCVLDAIHSTEEWSVILNTHPGSILVNVCAPRAIRRQRREEPERQDRSRIDFWHQGGDCLQGYVDWAIPGMLSGELLERICDELIYYVNRST